MNTDDATRPARPSRGELVAIAAITLLGLALRAHQYGARVPWIDEAETALYAQAPIKDAILRITGGPPITTPPFYFVVIRILSLLHLTGASHRLPSVLAGAGALPLVYLLGRRLWSRGAGLAAALLLAIAPVAVRYSQEARPYSLQLFTMLVLLIGAVGLSRGDARRDWAMFLGGGALTALLQFAGMPLVAIVALWLFYCRQDRASFLAGVLLALCMLPGAIHLWFGSRGVEAAMPHLAGFTLPVRFERIAAIVGAFGVGDRGPSNFSAFLTLGLSVLGGVALAGRDRRAAAMLWLALLGPIIAMAAPASSYPFIVRYGIHAVPIVAVFGGIALASLCNDRSRIVGRAVSVAVIATWAALAYLPLKKFYAETGTPYDRVGALLSELGDPSHERVFLIGGDEPVDFYAPLNVACLRPYLSRPFDTRFHSIYPELPVRYDIHRDWLVVQSPFRDMLVLPGRSLEFPTARPYAFLEKVVLGRNAANTGLWVHPPLRFERGTADGDALVSRASALDPNVINLVPVGNP